MLSFVFSCNAPICRAFFCLFVLRRGYDKNREFFSTSLAPTKAPCFFLKLKKTNAAKGAVLFLHH